MIIIVTTTQCVYVYMGWLACMAVLVLAVYTSVAYARSVGCD